MTTAKILSCYINKFEAFVATKNKKAIKLGCPEIKYEISEPFVQWVQEEQRHYEYVNVTVDESEIKLKGWGVNGRIDDLEGSIIVSGFSDMSAYRNISMSRCDHCNESRARKHLVLVSNGQEEKVVGSTCLTDFVGHGSALSYLSAMSWVMNLQESLDEEGFSSGSSDGVYAVQEIVALSAAATRLYGYVSRAKAEEEYSQSTADAIRGHLFSSYPNAKIDVSEEDREIAAKAVEWLDTVEENSDFFYNLKTIISKGYTKNRFIGFVVALIPMYLKSLNKVSQEPSEFIGEVGQKKVKITAECVSIVTLSGNYGTSWMFIMKAGSNVIKYVSAAFDAKIGEIYNLEATIKDHAVYNGTKQTVITRAKIVA